jgi:hypothetical protein
MGKSATIEDLQKNDAAFRTYLDGIEKDLATQSDAAQQKMRTDIDDFYTKNGYDDAKRFTDGKNVDFMHQSEFTMDNLKKVIDAVSSAVFAGAQPPAGSTVNEDAVKAADKALGPEVGAMANLELYIAGKVFDVLSNIIISFGTGTEVSFSSSTKSESLGYGIQMFTAVTASSYRSHSFFNNEYISQYLYCYDVRFSVKQAQSEAKMGIVQAYQNQLAVFEDLLTKLAESWMRARSTSTPTPPPRRRSASTSSSTRRRSTA